MAGIEIVVNDRRGQNKNRDEVVDNSDGFKEIPTADRSSWKDVGYLYTLVQIPGGPQLMVGRAAGLRCDDLLVVVDYVLPPVGSKPGSMDWTESVLKRLDTFLGCDCSNTAPCSNHRHNMPMWTRQDMERLNRTSNQPLPQAIELLMLAEQNREKSALVIPGR
jgi:hypothetical protein